MMTEMSMHKQKVKQFKRGVLVHFIEQFHNPMVCYVHSEICDVDQ